MEVLAGPFEKGCHDRFAGVWAQRLDDLVDAVADASGLDAHRPVERLVGDVDTLARSPRAVRISPSPA